MALTRQSWRRLGACGALALCFLGFTGCEAVWTLLRDDRKPNRYLIPEGFVGWVRIDFEVEGAPELPVESGFLVYRVPPTGHLETSSAIESGWASDEYYYVDSQGEWKRLPVTARGLDGMIWAHGLSLRTSHEYRPSGSTSRSTGVGSEHFFVGPEELSKRLPGRDADGLLLYGPVGQNDGGSAPPHALP